MSTSKSKVEQPSQTSCVWSNSAASTYYAQTNERLETFIRYFVKESEAKLYSYHLVLEGELKRSGKFTKAFSEAVGYGVGGVVGIVGMNLGLPSCGVKVLTKAGKSVGSKVSGKIGNELYAKQVRQLADIVDFSQKSKATFRKALVEAGFDIFQSFEMQFMGVSVDQSSSSAMHVLAKDAINRAVSYLKKNTSVSIPEGVLLGESKRKDLESPTTGFSVTYKSRSLKETWNTGSLYSKAGLSMLKDGKPHFLKKKESKTGKYGYRRLFNGEKWDVLSKVYVTDNIAESKSGHFTEYEYILDLKDMEVKCESLLKKINLDDKDLAEDRTKELLEEVKKDILEEINMLKTQTREFPEDREILVKLEECVNNLSSEYHFKRLKQYFSETKEEIANLIKESSENVVQEIQNMSNDNMEQHENTQSALGRLNEGIERIHKEQKANKQFFKDISQDFVDSMEKVKDNVEALVQQQQQWRNMDPIWFDMREVTESFTGRKKHLSQIAEYVEKGIVIITGLSGVGKSELAIKYARKYYNRDNNVIWINAQNRGTVKESFDRLYKKLGFKVDYESGIRSIAYDVYSHCSRQKSLFIFDDAEKHATIKDALPQGLPSDVNKPHVLITCHKLEVEKGMTSLQLGDFSIDESIDFIKKFYTEKDETQITKMEQLAEELHNFPLALQQAVAYISIEDKRLKNVNPKKEFTISDYLKEFDRKTEDLLKCEEFKRFGNDYDKTTYTALQISLDKVKNQKDSQKVLEILHIMAYFITNNIPASFFLELINEDERKLGAIIQLLKDYSIVSGEGLLDIHGLVQRVIRLELVKEVEENSVAEETILRKALELLMKYMIDNLTIEPYIPHIISVWNHASKYNSLIETFIVNYTIDPIPYTTYFHLIMERSPFGTVSNIIERIEENFPGELVKVINEECSNGATPLYCAVESDDERKVKLLMSKGGNVNVETKRQSNLLHVAAKNGYLDTIDDLLQKNININSETEYKFTPLHFAVKNEQLKTVSFLLTKGANATMKTRRGFTPLHFAVDIGSVDIVKTLLNYKTTVKTRQQLVSAKTRHEYTSLHLAAKHGHVEILNYLLQSGANVECKTRLKMVALHLAAEKGHLSIVEILLSKKAAVNVKDRNHFTPLHLAALHGHSDVVLTLIKNGADVNSKTSKHNTPLQFASQRGHLEVVKTLLTNNAKHDIRNEEGRTALDLAMKGNFVETEDHIIRHITDLVQLEHKSCYN